MIYPVVFLLSFALTHHQPILNIHFKQKINTPSEEIIVKKLSKSDPKLKISVIKIALKAYKKVFVQGRVKNPMLTIIDYSVPSNKRRMWIFNMHTYSLVLKTYVAHGRNSGHGAVPYQFSNELMSKESSLGTYITEDTYTGHKMRIQI